MRIIIMILAMILISGCAADDSSTEESKTDTESHTPAAVDSAPADSQPDAQSELEEERKNETTEVVDKDGRHLGEIAHNGGFTVTDRGIVYSYYADNGEDKKQAYSLFDSKSGKSIRLGRIEGEVFENTFNRVEIGDHVYTLAVVGNVFDDQPDPAYLVDIDLNGMTSIQTVSDDAFPYMAMCRHGDKLLYMLHDQQDVLYDRVFEFDPKTGKKKEVITAELGNDEKGDTLRQLWSDGERVYVLRIKMNTRSDVKMFLDTYGKAYSKLSEQDISDLLKKASHLAVNDDLNNEMIQMVSHFEVIDGRYIYYENFSTSRFFADLETGELLIDTNGLFTAVNGSGKTFWYWLMGGSETGLEPGLNALFELKNGTVEKSLLNAPEESKYQIYSASASPNGTSLFYLGYADPQTGEKLPPKLFLVEGH